MAGRFFSIFWLEKVLYDVKKGAEHFFKINIGLILTINGSFWRFFSKKKAFYSKKVKIVGLITFFKKIGLKKFLVLEYTIPRGLIYPHSQNFRVII